jgi:hypothetical protein
MTKKSWFIGIILLINLFVVPVNAKRVNVGIGIAGDNGFLSVGVHGGRGYHPYYGHFHHHHRYTVPYYRSHFYYSYPVYPLVSPDPVIIRPRGYWTEREERVWIEGCWIESVDSYGRKYKKWRPGYWQIRRIKVWVE